MSVWIGRYKIVSTKSQTRIRRFATICLKHDLHFLSGGLMKKWFRSPSIIDTIAIAYINKTPVGAAIIINHYDSCITGDCNIGVFVHDAYRQCGIGKALVERVKRRTDHEILSSKYRPEAKALYEGVGL